MGIRAKFVLALVGLSMLATAAIGVFSYRTTSAELRREIDASLSDTAASLQRRGGAAGVVPDRRDPTRSRSDAVVQVIGADGTVYPFTETSLPVTPEDLALASDDDGSVVRDVSSGGEDYRLLTTTLRNRSGAVQVARSLAETNQVLAALRRRIVVASVVVAAAAAGIGALLAGGLTRRLLRLTAAAEHVRDSGSLDVEVPVGGNDETARLGGAFRDMLGALSRSREDQQRLVQDAGHELRTPLTSLRTNVYMLRGDQELDDAARARVLGDIDGETRELTRLVEEVVEVATDRRGDEPEVPVELGSLVERVARRAAQRSGRSVVVHRISDVPLHGRPLALERAVGNLIENALKFDESSGPIEVTCEGGRVEVADRGPGIPFEDRDRVFDRFHRADAARSRPGSGLGLAIVRDVVERHGGRVFVADRAGGGAVVGFVLPVG